MTGEAKLKIDFNYVLGKVEPRIFGTLIEQLGRGVYGGLYDPNSKLSDEDGFRKDVLKLVKELGITTVRWPGGNFVSGYRWDDGVGPKDKRPRRLDLAWHSTETNQFGLHEMEKWLKKAGNLELMEALNMGTRGLESALDLLEYSNIPNGTKLSNERVKNGAKAPFNIRLWCLGNEMDGKWQLGHLDAVEYAKKISKVAAGMRQLDSNLELIGCGSSNHGMSTFGKWEDTLLNYAYDSIDLVSCHAYYHADPGELDTFLGSAVDMDRFIDEVVSSIDAGKARAKSDHIVNISFDEWNVWYQGSEPSKTPEGIDNWPVAPHLLEDVYSVTDAVVVGDFLITLLKHADRVKAASIAQLVNVIGPIMAPENGKAYRQTTFYPFSETAKYVKSGLVLKTVSKSPIIMNKKYGKTDMVNSVTIRCEDGSLAIIMVNRSINRCIKFEIELPGSGLSRKVVGAKTLHDDDPLAKNTQSNPNKVTLKDNDSVIIDKSSNMLSINLPNDSWSIINIK